MSKLGMEIHSKIEENNKIIESLIKPNQFTLNNTIAELLNQNIKLQENCPHEYSDEGYCIYCYKRER